MWKTQQVNKIYRRCLWLFVYTLILHPYALHAHEVRPAYLRLTETRTAHFSVLWKQPIINERRLKITPRFPVQCQAGTAQQERQPTTILYTYSLACDLRQGQIHLDGLERSLTDIFVDIRYLDGQHVQTLLKPDRVVMDLSPLSSQATQSKATHQYLRLGIEHILFGWDHVLFVIGLTLLIRSRKIWGVATAFTLAHSLTLGLAVFNLLYVPAQWVEIMITASIVLLGIEIIHQRHGRDFLTIRHPYLISFLIGLIHGCGFASSLADIGLPKNTELIALFLFNVGVELGQFSLIAGLMLTGIFLLKRYDWALRHGELWVTYTISSLAMFWFIERFVMLWT